MGKSHRCPLQQPAKSLGLGSGESGGSKVASSCNSSIKLNQCFARQRCRRCLLRRCWSCLLSLSIAAVLLQPDHGKSFGGKASSFVQVLAILTQPHSVQDATESQSKAAGHRVLLHWGQHPVWVLAAIAMPARYPQSRTPKHLAEAVLAPPVLPGAPVIGFVAPSSVCQVNCIAGSQLSGPWVRQRLAPYRTRAFEQNMRLVVASKPGCAREKFPADVTPSALPLEKPLV